MMTVSKLKTYAWPGLFVLAMSLLVLQYQGCDGGHMDPVMGELEDIKRERDSLGREIASREIATWEMLQRMAYSVDSMEADAAERIIALEKENKRLRAAVAINISTTDTIYGETDTIIIRESDSLPTYLFSRDTEWDSFDITASADSFSILYSVRNKLDISHTTDRRGLFKSVDIVQVKNLNPNSTTDNLMSYEIRQKPLFWKGFAVGAISIGIAGVFFIAN